MSHRSARLAETFKKEIALIVQRGLKDPRVGFVSITSVEVTGDLRYAKVFVSILGNESQTEETMKVLKGAQGYIRSELGKKIKLRYTPELIFSLDESISHGIKVMRILKEVHDQEELSKDE